VLTFSNSNGYHLHMNDDRTSPAKSEMPIQAADGNVANQPLTSRVLFGGRKEIVIVHDGEEYRLRITRNNKLILTK
jgi:hemin uptake protein HemP